MGANSPGSRRVRPSWSFLAKGPPRAKGSLCHADGRAHHHREQLRAEGDDGSVGGRGHGAWHGDPRPDRSCRRSGRGRPRPQTDRGPYFRQSARRHAIDAGRPDGGDRPAPEGSRLAGRRHPSSGSRTTIRIGSPGAMRRRPRRTNSFPPWRMQSPPSLARRPAGPDRKATAESLGLPVQNGQRASTTGKRRSPRIGVAPISASRLPAGAPASPLVAENEPFTPASSAPLPPSPRRGRRAGPAHNGCRRAASSG